MPEHEIAKHTKAVYKAWNSPHLSWQHKLREVFIEIGIIVFAITLSLFLERWREQEHERKIEKQFLTGLKKDLLNDIQQQKMDSTNYTVLLKGWDYFINAGKGKFTANNDSLHYYRYTLFNTVGFVGNDSRFEALKSSGEFGVIEDEELKNNILDLYQQQIKLLNTTTEIFNRFKQDKLVSYLNDNLLQTNDGSTNLNELLKAPKMQNYLNFGSNLAAQITEEYHTVVQQSQQVIQAINKQYSLND